MSLILSWIFGWWVGLGLPVVITCVAGYLVVTTTGTIRRLAIDALIVAGCWAGMTVITQSAVAEAVQHERAAVAKAVADEQTRQQVIYTYELAHLNAQLLTEQQATDDAEQQADDLQKWILAHPIAGRGATQEDLDVK